MWRTITPVAAAALSAALFATSALAQVDLKVTVPAAPGSGWDQTAHAMEEALLDSGAARSVAVANLPGGRGTAGFVQFVRGEPEPNRVIVIGFSMLGALLRGKSGVSLSDAAPLARLTADYLAIAVPAESPLASARDLADAVQADPAKVTWGGGQAGSIDHILAALFTKAVGADPARMAYAPFFGVGEMLDAAFAGQVTAVIASPRQLEEPVKAGRLKVVAVTAPIRLDDLDAPTLKEQGIDLVLANWRAVMAPAGLKPEAFATLAATVDVMVRSPAWEDVLRRKDWHNAYLPPERFAAFLEAEQARVTDALKSVGLAK
ncbi:MAG TPA: tripartite tricarboxylate transporter substrate-binding protein [Beijerinckiaceae bacterium]|jgi:putative tricarboxylic transport membrane protein